MARYTFIFLFFMILCLPAMAQDDSGEGGCEVADRACILRELEETAAAIDNPNWKDQTLRELAKTYAADGDIDKALSLVASIENPDTKAMTIRGIGMAAAGNELNALAYDVIFKKLRAEAERIDHPPSYAIALTYIAMAQAFAGDDEGAWETAGDMENEALRHKAYGETAEIQAEKGNFEAAMISIERIESEAYRNKAYGIISKLFADQDMLGEALEAANKIGNAYKKAESIQYILDIQKPREVVR